MFPEVTHPLINPHGPIGRRIVARTTRPPANELLDAVMRAITCMHCGLRHKGIARVWRYRYAKR